ncbi:MAG: metal ABC transporter permease, partial [Clostridia bacterium]|nr:metal ABC transporter permease [Clostridia bacterium]
MFNYEFMRVAFLVGILLAIIMPLIGSVLVFKRLSMIGDSLSHTALAGVAIGLIAGYNPIWGAIAITILATLFIEVIRKKFPKYTEISLAIVMSAGIALSGLLSSFVPANNFNSYLFGSIISITSLEVYLAVGLFIAIIAFFIIFYKELMFISYNENSAKLAGVPVKAVNFILSLLTAIMVALAAKIIGALIVSSIMVIPTAISLQIAKSYKNTLLIAVAFSVTSLIIGLTTSFYIGLKPGGTVAL